MEEVIDLSKLDKDFKYQVVREPGGEGLLSCFACGTCAASCPVREIDDRFNPRRLIRMAILGMKDRVLQDEFIYLCSGCYLCQERCPQDVGITELMTALRNIAVREGYLHPSFKAQLEFVYEFGRLYELTEFENKKRKKNGLPELNAVIDEVKTLLKEAGLSKFVEVKE